MQVLCDDLTTMLSLEELVLQYSFWSCFSSFEFQYHFFCDSGHNILEWHLWLPFEGISRSFRWGINYSASNFSSLYSFIIFLFEYFWSLIFYSIIVIFFFVPLIYICIAVSFLLAIINFLKVNALWLFLWLSFSNVKGAVCFSFSLLSFHSLFSSFLMI